MSLDLFGSHTLALEPPSLPWAPRMREGEVEAVEPQLCVSGLSATPRRQGLVRGHVYGKCSTVLIVGGLVLG